MSAVNKNINCLNDLQEIQKANSFLEKVATSERNKEIAVIKSYCQQTGKQFPILQPYLNNPDMIYQNPEEFYAALTAAINEARKGTKNYLAELKRIKSNIEEKDRTLQDYKAEDYRYRLSGDISSFLNRLRGKYVDVSNEDSFSLKVQQLVMRILEDQNIPERISSGEDFAAIASAVLVEVEQKVQEKIDDKLNKTKKDKDLAQSKYIDEILDEVEKEYLNSFLKEKNKQTPVQKALLDLKGLDFIRITNNAKKILGLKTTSLEGINLEKTIQKLDKKDKNNKNNSIRAIRQSIRKNILLKTNLNFLEFSISGSANTKHGTIYEFIESMLGEKVRGNVGVDILTYTFNWELRQNTQAIDELLSNMGESLSSVLDSEEMDKPSNIRDLRNTLYRANKEISKLIEETEKQISSLEEFKDKDVFVFHESLKLYSSVETGRGPHSGFSGRSMNILSYIDYLSTAAEIGTSGSIDRTGLGFLALNLGPGAVAEDFKSPLEKYFSIYAGMIMFDDLANMAEEAVSQINTAEVIGGKVRQIHLYNLNGIYVPASMLLSYVSDTVKGASQSLATGTAAEAVITVPSSISAYEDWQSSNKHLNPAIWQQVAAESASNTKVKIIFLQTFKNFIERL